MSGAARGVDRERPAVIKATVRGRRTPLGRGVEAANARGEVRSGVGAPCVPQGGRDVPQRVPSSLRLLGFFSAAQDVFHARPIVIPFCLPGGGGPLIFELFGLCSAKSY